MRHIPEDELHAYLDQALSRSQCVEIESHLARCETCRRERNDIAALRDRTTALLATLAPSRRIPPSFELLRRQAAQRSARRVGRWRAAAWAASVLVAVGLGWGARSFEAETAPDSVAAAAEQPSAAPERPRRAPEPLAVVTPAAADPDAQRPARKSGTALRGDSPAVEAPAAARERPAARAEAEALLASESNRTGTPRDSVALGPSQPVGARLSSGQLPIGSFNGSTGALFRTVSWDRARFERGESVPRIAGLPVVEVQLAGSRGQDSRPLMVVAQQLESGQVIRTIEGPATDVTQLLASQAKGSSDSPWPTMDDGDGIAGGDGAMAVRRGDRILAITAPLSSDSLRAMIRRLNATER
ncbi:MAG TPA: zf-HC2 domain-containing protein [Gemmatimonadales bacterium]|nr:zf-HC2 domain-containing protein [Gemmatimonadales bacterium]